nr:type VI secretion system Vgr family protein [Acinetobacter sp. Marseille-Q1620]
MQVNFDFLKSLGITSRNRVLHLSISDSILGSQVFLHACSIEQKINGGLDAQLICLSTNAHLQLKSFIGCQAAIDVQTDRGQYVRTTGIIVGAEQGQSDGALSIYKLVLKDAFSLLDLKRNSRVFENKSVIDVIEILFKDWKKNSPLFASSLSLDTSLLNNDYDIRPNVISINEQESTFVTRLLRSEGVNWFIDEDQLIVDSPDTPIQPQKFKLIDDNSQFNRLPRGSLSYHRSDATEKFDTITSFRSVRRLQPTSVHIQRWHAEILEQEDGAGSVLSSHKHSSQLDNSAFNVEQSWLMSPAWISDLNGEDGTTKATLRQVDRLNSNLKKYYDMQSKYCTAISSVRDVAPGYWFEFNEHPEIDTHSESDKEFLILERSSYFQNNFPKDVSDQIDNLLEDNQWQLNISHKEERQITKLKLIRKNIPVVPEYDLIKHKPTAYPMHIRVVGVQGETVHVDEWGRIKGQFLFSRQQDNTHDGGAGSNINDTDSAWLPVLTSWAGEGFGARFLPRVNEIAVVFFMNGDIDRPFVLGRLHEGDRHPTKFDTLGKLPDTRYISGIRTNEIGASGYNQLRFEDSTGNISAQLQSTYAVTQLNLGKLSHPRADESFSGRGEGYELRTDAYGALRAGKGMLITTYGQSNASANHLDAAEAQKLLDQAKSSMKSLSDLAIRQKTDALNVVGRLPKLIESLQIKSTSQALNATLEIFKEGMANDPINALKNCGGFLTDITQLGGGSITDIVNDFNQAFENPLNALGNVKDFIENVEDFGTDLVKNKLGELRNNFKNDPFSALQNTKNVLSDIDINDFNLSNLTNALSGGAGGLSGLLGSVQGFMQNMGEQLTENNSVNNKENGTLFRQALMLFASPSGIAMATEEDFIVRATQDIGLSTGTTYNVSAQKNIVMQAQAKVSLFAASNGLSAYAGKGVVDIQAQNGAMKLYAKEKVEIISTGDTVHIKAKKIILESEDGRITLGQGILSETSRKHEIKAGQIQTYAGVKYSLNLPILPFSELNDECPMDSLAK